jgi:DNA-binding NtrC family response regulator
VTNGRAAARATEAIWARDLKPLADIEREVIVQTLEHFNGHRAKTAAALGIGVRTLGLKLKKWKEQQLVAQTL